MSETGLKLVYEPQVYVVGRQVVDEEEVARFLANEEVPGWSSDAPSAGEKICEIGGRLCYMSFGKPRPGGNAAYLQHIKEVGHGSVLEHAVWSLLITGVSRSLTHELIRHRAGISPSQLSQRYVDESSCEFVVPPNLIEEVKAGQEVFKLCWENPEYNQDELSCLKDDYSQEAFSAGAWIGIHWLVGRREELREYTAITDYLEVKAENRGLVKTEARKYARQTARSVLPNAAETKILLTGNARAWRNFIELRAKKDADTEIRRLAVKVYEVLVKEAPNLFGDYESQQLGDRTQELNTPYRKV